jgi:beta-phosphoglucomutase
MPGLRAVIFDVDGVLVQSMEKHHEAYQAAFAPLGVEVSRADVFKNEGRGSREVIESLIAERGLRLSKEQVDGMVEKKGKTFLGFGPMPKYPGVDELVESLRARGLRLGMVTGTSRKNIEHHFAGWLARFDVIVTADDVKRTKPDPEPYLRAVEKLALPPAACVVVENAPLGIRSAKAAGLRVVAITSTNPADVLKEADAIVASIRDVERAL